MYENFFGLSEPPFELTSNPKYIYLSMRQREALSVLEYGLFSAKSLTLLVGDAGTGKTTLIQAALASQRCENVRAVYINNPTLRPDDFIKLLARKLKLSAEAGESKAVLLEQLEALLRERRAAGITTALVVDEAQSLNREMLEEIRLLANIETPEAKLLPVVLAGQTELAARLEEPDLRQLKQRVALRALLEPYDLEHTAAYIASRISTAGGSPGRMFSLDAVTLIHEMSGGVPRTINVICDNALLGAMALGRQRVDRACVAEVSRDFQLTARAHATTETEQRHRPVIVPPPTPRAPVEGSPEQRDIHKANAVEKTPDSVERSGRSAAAASFRRAGRTITE
jgi:general secretion pathway protein A